MVWNLKNDGKTKSHRCFYFGEVQMVLYNDVYTRKTTNETQIAVCVRKTVQKLRSSTLCVSFYYG